MGKVYEKVTDQTLRITETMPDEKRIISLTGLKDKLAGLQNQIERFQALKAEVDLDIAEAVKLGVKEDPTTEIA